jgi:hypothetical protein
MLTHITRELDRGIRSHGFRWRTASTETAQSTRKTGGSVLSLVDPASYHLDLVELGGRDDEPRTMGMSRHGIDRSCSSRFVLDANIGNTGPA